MKKLQNEYLSLAIGTSVSTLGKVDSNFIKSFLMGLIIGRCKRDVSAEEISFINNLKI